MWWRLALTLMKHLYLGHFGTKRSHDNGTGEHTVTCCHIQVGEEEKHLLEKLSRVLCPSWHVIVWPERPGRASCVLLVSVHMSLGGSTLG